MNAQVPFTPLKKARFKAIQRLSCFTSLYIVLKFIHVDTRSFNSSVLSVATVSYSLM